MKDIESGSEEAMDIAPLMDPLISSERKRYERRKQKKERKRQRKLQKQLQQAFAKTEQLDNQLNDLMDDQDLPIEDLKPGQKKAVGKMNKERSKPKAKKDVVKVNKRSKETNSNPARSSPDQINSNDPRVYYPKVKQRAPNTTVNCKGCGLEFKCYKPPSSNQIAYPNCYYDHCILECDQFKKLNFIKQCEQCPLLFLSSGSLTKHRNKAHKKPLKPNWMSKTQFDAACSATFNWNSTKICEGCGQKFKSKFYQDKGNTPELAYFIHVVEECNKYKELGLLRRCEKCFCVYFNELAYQIHLRSHDNEQRPPWISLESFRTAKRIEKTGNSLRPCEGCGKMFKVEVKQLKYKESVQFEFDYYVHVVEMCDRFKELGLLQKCEPCGLVFITSGGYTRHLHAHHKQVLKKPEWMSSHTFEVSERAALHNDCERPCPGCGKLFKAKSCVVKNGPPRYQLEFAYYIHVVNECKEYKVLNLIRTCHRCKSVFINPLPFQQHIARCEA